MGLPERVSEGLKKDLELLERDIAIKKLQKATEKEAKQFKLPFKVKRILNASLKKKGGEKILFFYFNCKSGEVEPPILLPYTGNMVVYKHKVYKLNPKAIWTLRWGPFNKTYKAYFYRDFDRRPISSGDYENVVLSGNSTEDDEILIKAALSARVNTLATNMNWKALLIGGLVLAGILMWIFTS